MAINNNRSSILWQMEEMLRGSVVTTEPVSPVTLSGDWSRVARLLLLTAMFVAGSVGNVFMISATMIEDHLRKKGNAFLVNFALADLLVTGLVMPASIIAILAEFPDNASSSEHICAVQWHVALVSCFVTVLTFSTTAVENYTRLFAAATDCYDGCLTPCRITAIIVCIWIAVGAVVTLQAVFQVGPDYCRRGFLAPGALPAQVAVCVVFVLIPVLVTVVFYTAIGVRVRSYRAALPAFKTHVTFNADYDVVKTNALGFIVFIAFWLPFGVVLLLGTVSRKTFYNLAWLALSKSCVNSLIYCIANRHFRNAYINLFHYCCCKTTVSFSRRPLSASQGPLTRAAPADVRVHIIPPYNMNYTSPMRGGATTAPSAPAKRPTIMRSPRDVYEL